jgi:hypothetical protein
VHVHLRPEQQQISRQRAGPLVYNEAVTTARRTLCCWVLMTFLERGCDPTADRRRPRRVTHLRALSARELAELQSSFGALVPVTNLRFLPRGGRSARSTHSDGPMPSPRRS